MLVLGIETSCDECAAALVEDGRRIRSSVVATQIPFHERYQGVVPEIASRKHSEWIWGVVQRALDEAEVSRAELDGIAVTTRPGLVGSLLVGLCFAKGLAWSLRKPLIGIDHILAHLYAPQLENKDDPRPPPAYPFLGLLVSGGHCIICEVMDFDRIEVLGTTIDDAIGEAFDKVAKRYDFGYPGGPAVDRLAKEGDALAFDFPKPSLHKGEHRYDVSYSGLKTAAAHQLEQYRRPRAEASPANIAASFQKAAIDILLSRVFRAVEDRRLSTLVAGGGVAANSYLRRSVAEAAAKVPGGLDIRFPPLALCGDNGAMVAGLGCMYLARGESSSMDINVSARVPVFKRR